MKSLIRLMGRRVHTVNRLGGLFVVLSLLLLMVAGIGAWRIGTLQAQSEEMLAANVLSIRAAVELEMHIQELRHQLDRMRWAPRPEDMATIRQKGLQSMASRRPSIEMWLKRSEETARSDEERVLIAQVRSGLDDFYGRIATLDREEGVADSFPAQAYGAEKVLEHDVLAPAQQYLNLDENLLESSGVETATQSRRLVYTLLFLGVAGAISALAAGFALARAISQTLVQLRIPMQDVAGKLSEVAGDVVVSTTLDLADLGPALERVSQKVSSVVEELQARHQEILHADQLATVGQLAAGIAHEIRNPLMSMKLLVQSARGDAGRLEQRDLQILDEEIRRLEVLLAEFLDFARPKPLTKSMVDLTALAENTVAFMQRQADARKVILDCELPSEALWLELDSRRIRQVLVNLLLNAIQVTPAGKCVRLEVEGPDAQVENQQVVRVADEGPGISEGAAVRIFEPFYSTKETGLGLGLAVSQRIVRSHGGDILLQPNPAGGATFVVILPGPAPNALKSA